MYDYLNYQARARVRGFNYIHMHAFGCICSEFVALVILCVVTSSLPSKTAMPSFDIPKGKPAHRLLVFAWVMIHLAEWVVYGSVWTVLLIILGMRKALVCTARPFEKGYEMCMANGKTELAEWFRLQGSLILWYRRQLSRLYNWIFNKYSQWIMG